MKLFLVLISSLIFSLVLAENPLHFPEYKQNVKISYPISVMPDDVSFQILPLPEGKKIAYTARWDDTNPLNLKMAELLKKHGMKGTFMLHSSAVREQGKKLLEYGHAIGNHTEHHYWLPMNNPNQIFYEIAMYQVMLETELQTSVVSFVFPFGSGSDLFKDFRGTCLKVFDCSNLYVFPFYWKNANRYFNRPENILLATNLFASDDRNPTVALYQQRMRSAKKSVSPAIPRITHGIHVWMKPAGFKELDAAFAETSKDPDFIFLTDNEYGAYRYSFLHAAPQLKSRRSGDAVFEVTRFLPGHLGSEIPLTLRIEPVPEKVEVDGVVLQRDQNGFWILPHSQEKKMPAFYEWLKDSDSVSKQLPGLKLELIPDSQLQNFEIRLINHSGKNLKNVFLQLSLPPKWVEPKKTRYFTQIKDGETISYYIDSGKVLDDPDFSEGIYNFILRLDFDGGRIYRTISMEGTPPGEGIHTMLRYLGPFPKNGLSEEAIQKFSNPGRLEHVVYQGVVYSWKKYSSAEYNRYSFDLRSKDYRNRELVCPVIAEFIMPEDGEVRIAMYHGTEFYCNGTFIGKQRRHYNVKAKKGRNRLYFPHAAKYESIVIFPPGKLVAPEEF